MKVTFQLVNSRHESIQDDIDLDVQFIPREGEKVDLFGRSGIVVGVRHVYARGRGLNTTEEVTVTVQAM